MSEFIIETREIERIEEHPNAERLQLAYVKGLGYQYVVQKGQYAVGQSVVVFPVDSVLPIQLQERLGLPKPRIRSIRLRGAFSEGFLATLDSVGLLGEIVEVENNDLAAYLGVGKYEPPITDFNRQFGRPENLYKIPVSVYDLENAQRYPEVIASLQNTMVVITEKLEGSNFWARISKDNLSSSLKDQRIEVGQRHFGIKIGEMDTDLHVWWKTFFNQGLDQFLFNLSREYPGYDVTVRGEIIGEGIQGNYYNLKGHRIHLFEIELDDVAVSAVAFQGLTHRYGAITVPTVYVGYLRDFAVDATALTAMSSFDSALIVPGQPSKLREGIVIRPLEHELYDTELGRVILKVRDPIYMAQ